MSKVPSEMNAYIDGLKLKKISIENLCLDQNELIFEIVIKARPQSQRSSIVVSKAGEIGAYLKAQAQEGRANQELIKLVSKQFGISKSSILLKSGEKSRSKRLQLRVLFTKYKTADYYIEKIQNIILK